MCTGPLTGQPQPETVMKRYRQNRNRSRRQFNKRARKTARLNKTTSYRGGIRL